MVNLAKHHGPEYGKILRRHTKKELLFKVLVIGDFGVGKTSIVRRYANGVFSASYKITIGADFAVKQLQWDNATKINLQLWDIAGHERFGYLTSVYYRYAVAAAIVFDLTRPETFNSIEKWLKDLRNKVLLPNGEHVPVIILANKGDICLDQIPEHITEFCKINNILTWFITSAKENANIDEAMAVLVEQIMANHENKSTNNNNSIVLKQTQQKKKLQC